jgi:C4-dicarboxylate-specific signal transduction histidine kinase
MLLLISDSTRYGVGITPAKWTHISDRRLADLKATGAAQPYEKEYFRKNGSRIPVLVGAARFEEGGSEGVAFVLDLSDSKRAEEAARESERRYREIQMELAHANRIATIGQLSASIAHEVNQPVAVTITNAQTALRWMSAQPPNMEKVRQALDRIVRDGNRAGDVIGRIRALINKAPPRKSALGIGVRKGNVALAIAPCLQLHCGSDSRIVEHKIFSA